MKKVAKITFTVVGSIAVYELLRRTGALDKVKGSLKMKLGSLLDDPKLQFEGGVNKFTGEAKELAHDVKSGVNELFEN